MPRDGYSLLPGEPSAERRDDDNRADAEGPEDDEDDEIIADVDAEAGVRAVEAAEKVYGPQSRWFLYVGLGLAAYIYSLDSSTTYNYLPFATSAFGGHALISAIQVVQSIVIAVGKPVIAKLADVSSRGKAYVIVLCFYVAGYLIIASAPAISFIAAGIIVYAVGQTGVQLLTQIIIADITSLRWRGLVWALGNTPFLANAFIGAVLSSWVVEHSGWRVGYLMFAVLVPLGLAPLVLTLLWGERKAARKGLVDRASGIGHSPEPSTALHPPRSPSSNAPSSSLHPPSNLHPPSSSSLAPSSSRRYARPPLQRRKTWVQKMLVASEQLDLVGLALLGAAVALVLLPLTLSERMQGGWRDPRLWVMLGAGCAAFAVFLWWDLTRASRPVVARRFLSNRTVVTATIVGCFDFMSFYVTYTYLFSFALIVKPWSLRATTYFTQVQSVSMTVFAIAGGLVMQRIHGYKRVLLVGLAIRITGVVLMVHSRGENGSSFELVMTQIMQGAGGGLAAVASQVGAQASVPHADVALVIAIVLLLAEIGAATGGGIAGGIWANTMPGNLRRHLPWLSEGERMRLFGSIVDARSYPHGDPVREGVIKAYDDTMMVMVLVATALSVVPLVLAIWIPEWYLGDGQNAVADEEDEQRNSLGPLDDWRHHERRVSASFDTRRLSITTDGRNVSVSPGPGPRSGSRSPITSRNRRVSGYGGCEVS